MFPACLDELFNVQVIKGRYSLDVRLKDAIANRCQATISNIYKGTRTARSRLATRQHASAAVPAERRTSGLFGKLKRNPIDAKDHAQKKKDLEQRKAAVIAEVEREADADIAKAKLDVEQAKTAEDAKLLALAKEKAEAIVERAKERKANVRNRFKNDAFCRRFVKPLRGGDLYALEDFHDEIWVTINEEAAFFQSLYERATQNAEQQSLLDLMIFAIAYAEADKANSDEMKAFWVDARRNISRLSHVFVSVFDFEETPADDEEPEVDPDADPATFGGQTMIESF